MLLVLDNCEHVADGVAELAATLLEGAAFLTILATSRRPLGVLGETRYQVPSMTVPPTELGLSDAERLFHDRAARVDSGFTATPANASDVARICRDLDGLPLAIEMAAARVNLLTPGQIAGYLDERFQFLDTASGMSHEGDLSVFAPLSTTLSETLQLIEHPTRTSTSDQPSSRKRQMAARDICNR